MLHRRRRSSQQQQGRQQQQHQQQQQQRQQQQQITKSASPQELLPSSSKHKLFLSEGDQQHLQYQQQQQRRQAVLDAQQHTLLLHELDQAAPASINPILSDISTCSAHNAAAVSACLQQLSGLQLVQVIRCWAQQSRSLSHTAVDATALRHVIDECAALAQHKLHDFDRQQLADVTWSLAHFDQLYSRSVTRRIPATATNSHEPAATLAANLARTHGNQIAVAQHSKQWSGHFISAMAVPFEVIPCFLPHLQLDAFVAEVQLNRDNITLDGGSRLVPESRLTGWQSDIGATFEYSGKVMEPPAGGMTPHVAQVRCSC